MRSDMKQVHRHTTLVSCLALLGLQLHAQTPPVASSALPQGANLVSGQATVTQTAPNALSIGQTSNRAVLDWNSFNIGSQASVQFNQPNANAVVLNRVLDTNPSQILGRLSANGQVFISNPAGVLFGPTAQVNVAGLVATTQAISNEDFNQFGAALAVNGQQGAVVNQGQITAALGGYIALLAPEVRNEGVLLAREGTVALAAGAKTVLQFADSKLVSVLVEQSVMDALVVNKQVIRADGGLVILSARSANAILGSVIQQSGTIETLSLVSREGRVFLDGGTQGLVDMSGQISAAGVDANTKGGEVVVTGDKVTLSAQARVDASGQAGGGKVLIGGDWQGQNPLIRQANEVIVKPGAVLNASALNKGHGGTVVVWSNIRNTQGSTQVQGQLLARGGALGGDGGRIETSGHQLNTNGVQGDASAPAGQAGTWLFDPWNVEITSASVNNNESSGTWTASGSSSTIANTAINSLLEAGTNVVVSTTGIGTEAGNITVSAPITRSTSTGSANLTLNADNNIIIGSAVNISGSGSNLNLNAGGTGGVALNAAVTVDTLNVSVPGAGTVTQSAAMDVNNLKLVGTGSAVALNHTSNRIGTLAANVNTLGLVSTTGANLSDPYGTGLYIGTVAGLNGVTAVGDVNIAVRNGNLFVNQNIATSSTNATALVLNAGADLAVGAYTGATSSVNPYGFNIILGTGKTITMGSGATGKLYSGSVAGSGLALSTYVGSGSGKFRYNSNATTTNYSQALGTGLNLIYRQNPQLSISSSSRSITYGASFSALTPTVTGLLNADTASGALQGLSESLTGNSTSTQGYTKAGSYAITPSALSLLGYGTSSSNGTLTVTPKALTVTALVTDANNKVYDGTAAATLQLSTNKFDNDLVTAVPSSAFFANKNVGTGKTITATGLSLTGADAANYSLSSTTAASTGNITAKALSLSYAGVNKVYDSTAIATVTVTDDRVAGDVLTIGRTAVFSDKNVGTGKTVTVSGAALSGTDSGNYSLSSTTGSTTADITQRTLTISGITGPSRAYDGTTTATPNTSAIVYSNKVSGDSLNLSTSSGVFTDSKDVGTNKPISLTNVYTGTDLANYNVVDQTSTTGSVTPKTLTATLTASNKVYDQTTAATATIGSITGLVGSETVTATGTSTFNTKNVGTGKTVTVNSVVLANGTNGGVASNYSLASGFTTTANITAKSLSVTAAANNKAYDGTATATYVLSSDQYLTDLLTITGTTGLFSDKNAANGKTVSVGGIAVSGTDASNYSLVNTTTTTTANITPKALTASVTAPNKTYDGNTTATPTLTITSGLVGAETVAATGIASFNSKNVANANTVTVNNTSLADGSNGGLATNYSLAAGQTVAAYITPKALTATVAAPNKTYDGTTTATPTLTINPAGLVGSETVTATGTATFNTKNVATANLVTVNTTTLANGDSGGVASNYSLAAGQTVAASITARAIAVDAPTVTKIYDGSSSITPSIATINPLLPTTATGSSLGTSDAITASDLAYASARAGTSKVVNASNLVIRDNSGTGEVMNSNYTITYNANNASVITPKTLTTTLTNTGVTKVYDATTAAPSGFTPSYSWSGFISGDTAATLSNTSSAYNTKNVSTANQVTVSGLAITAVTGSNSSAATDYQLDSTSKTVAATITPATLTPTLSNTGVTKVYDASTAAPTGFAPTYTWSGLVAGDSAATLSSTSSSYNSKNVSTANQLTVNGLAITGITGSNSSLATDYVLNANSKTVAASITPKTIIANISNTGVSKVYDGANSAPTGFAPTYTWSGLVAGDTGAAVGNTGMAYNSARAALANQITVSGMTLSSIVGTNSSLAGDYALDTNSKTVTATITAKTLTPSVSNTGVTKVYDGSTDAPSGFTPTYTWSGFIGGDTAAALTNTGSSYNSQNVVAATTVTVNGLALTGSITGSNSSALSDYALDATAKPVAASITAKPLTATATAASKTYDGTNTATPVLSITSGLVGTETVTATGTASYNSQNVSTANLVTVNTTSLANGNNGGLATNYSLAAGQTAASSITPKTITPTLSNTNVTKVYDGSTTAPSGFAPTYTWSGLVTGDNAVTLSNTSSSYNTSNVSTANRLTVNGLAITGITGSAGSLTSDYVLDATSKGVAASITPKTLTASMNNTGVTKVYDGTTTAPTGFVPSFTWLGFITGDTAASTSHTAANYNSARVNSANQITVNGLALTGSITGSATTGSLISDYAMDANSKTVAATITPKTLTATISNSGVSKVYDGSTAAPTGFAPAYTWSGLVSGDTSATLSNTGSAYNSKDVSTANQITVNGLVLSNVTGNNSSVVSDYAIDATSKTVAASITPKTLTATVTAPSKTYDGTTTATPTLTITPAGFVTGETVTASGTASFNSKNVNEANLVTVNTTTLTNGNNGGLSSNYHLPAGQTVAANISRRDLTLTAPQVIKTYDGTTTALTSSANISNSVPVVSSGALAANDSLTGSSLLFDTPRAGNNKTVTVGQAVIKDSLNADMGSNYNTTYAANTSSTINPKTLTPSLGNTGVTKVYDSNTTAPTGFAPQFNFSGLVAGDTAATLTSTGSSYNSANVTTATQVSVSGLNLTAVTGSAGSTVSDYVLSGNSVGVSATITPKPVTVTGITAQTKIYDQATNAGVNSTAAQIQASASSSDDGRYYSSDQVTLDTSNASGQFDNKNSGADKTVTVNGVRLGGTAAGNYIVNPITARASITPKLIAATGITAEVKTYNNSSDIGINVDSARINAGATSTNDNKYHSGDNVSLDARQAKGTLTDKQIGNNKTVQISGLRLEGVDAPNYMVQGSTTTSVQPEYANSAGLVPITNASAPAPAVLNLSVTPNSLTPSDTVKDLALPTTTANSTLAPVATPVMPNSRPSLAQQAIQGVTPKTMSQWSDVQVQSLPAAQVAAMEVSQLKQVIRLLNPESQIRAINPQVLSKLDLQTLSGLSNKQINALTPEQLANMTKAQINYMMPILSPAQVNALRGKS
ncbi:Filamentous haemagglutinin, N-terminal [Burkholderiaceae bacterium]